MKYTETKRVLIIVLFLNLTVTLLKAIFGIMANSLSMIADSIHSLFDTSSNIIGLVFIRIARKPPDVDHPYGHGKYETIATLIIVGLLTLTSFEIIENAFSRIRQSVQPDITLITFAVMIVTLIIGYFVSKYEHEQGERLHSSILIADSLHTKSDVYASLSVIIGFIMIKAGYPFIDSLIALLIVAFIVRTAYGILKESSKILCDVSMISTERIKQIVESIPKVKSCHKIRSRGGECDIYLDLHIVLNPNIKFGEAHKISHKVEETLKKELPEITDVVVHTEPER